MLILLLYPKFTKFYERPWPFDLKKFLVTKWLNVFNCKINYISLALFWCIHFCNRTFMRWVLAIFVTPTPYFFVKLKNRFFVKKRRKIPDPPLAKFNMPIFGCPMVGSFRKYALEIWSFPGNKSLSALGLIVVQP